MTSTNGQAENSVEITTAHLQALFRRLPAAEVMRMIMLEAENASLKARIEALEDKAPVAAKK